MRCLSVLQLRDTFCGQLWLAEKLRGGLQRARDGMRWSQSSLRFRMLIFSRRAEEKQLLVEAGFGVNQVRQDHESSFIVKNYLTCDFVLES